MNALFFTVMKRFLIEPWQQSGGDRAMLTETSLTDRKLTGITAFGQRMLSGVGIFLVCLLLMASTSFAETVLFVDSTGRRVFVDTENPGQFAMPEAASTKQLETTAIAFTVTYMDVELGTGVGFDDPVLGSARRETAELTLEYLDLMLNETGGCDILFERSETDGFGFLASAGTYYFDVPGFTNGVAFDHITTGVDPEFSIPDISAVVDFGWSWNVGSGTPSFTQFDLLSVLIHEITHGLGILGLSDDQGQSYFTPPGGVFTVWDKFLETGNGNDLWNDFTAQFIGQPSWLLGMDGGVVFAGPNAISAFGGPAPVYAPFSWEEGSSLSHFDFGIPGGAVMEPFVNYGEVKREHTPVEIGALQDLGYGDAVAPSSLPEASFSISSFTADEGDATAAITVQLSFAPGPGNTAQVDYTTSDDTAAAGLDYTAISGTLTFGPTDTTSTFAVRITDDAILEGDETLVLTLTSSAGARLAENNNPSTLAILDDDPDADGDGISDDDERDGTFGYVTDPSEADTDGDGMRDGWEMANDIDPTNEAGENGADGDPDSDGQTNLEEYLGGTDPRDVSSVPGDLAWSTFIGGTMDDQVGAVAVDSSGAVYAAGRTTSADFATPGNLSRDSLDGDVVVLKLSPDGTSLEYLRYIGGSGDDGVESIVVDSLGRIYIAGWTTSDDFPTTSDGDTTFGGISDGFVTLLSADGSAIEYSSYIGGIGDDSITDIALNAEENILYAVGFSSSTDLPVSPDAAYDRLSGGYDGFLGKLDDVSFEVTYLGGTEDDYAYAIAMNSQDEPFVVGETESLDFPVTSDALQASLAGAPDAFITRFSSDLSKVVHSTYYGGSSEDAMTDIVVRSSREVYVAGGTRSDDFPVTDDAVQTQLRGQMDGFVVKMNLKKRRVKYATYLGGDDDDFAVAVAVDRSGMAYVTGYTTSSNFPNTPEAFDALLGGDTDSFLAVLSSRGSTLAYATLLGGSDDDWGTGAAMDEDGHVLLAGVAYSIDFPTTGGVFDEIFNSEADSHIAKFDLAGLRDPDFVRPPAAVTEDGHHSSDSGIKKLNPCFVATAAYGAPTADQVRTLLEFRDTYLLTTRAGCALVRAYYRLSPSIARYIEGRPLCKKIVRTALAPVVLVARAAVGSPVASAVPLVVAIALFLWLRTFSMSCARGSETAGRRLMIERGGHGTPRSKSSSRSA
jgi:hypothetical protein